MLAQRSDSGNGRSFRKDGRDACVFVPYAGQRHTEYASAGRKCARRCPNDHGASGNRDDCGLFAGYVFQFFVVGV